MRQLLCLLLLSAFWLPLSALAETVQPPPSIAVRIVHPDSLTLAREGKPAPEGYTPYVYEFLTRDGKMQRERLFLKDEPVITEREVERADADLSTPGQINITLNTRGGREMKKTTSAMKLGRDRLAVLVHGRVTMAPVVQAILSNTFVISGLDKANEAENLAELLNRRAAAGKAASFTPRDLALYAVHPDSDRLVKEGTLSVPGYRLWSRPGTEEGKNAEKEYLFLGNAPIVTGDYAQSARPNPDYPGHLDIVWNEDAYRKLEQACAALRPGKDRIAVVLRGDILSTPVLHGMPSHNTLISVLGDDRRLDDLCTAINTQLPPLTEQQQRKAKEELAVYPVHPRSAELEQRFLPELRQGKTIHLKSGFRSVPYTRPDFPEPVPSWAFIRQESLIGPEDIQNVERHQDGAITCQLLPQEWEKARAFLDAIPAGQVKAAVVFQGRIRHQFALRRVFLQLWGVPVLSAVKPISTIYIPTPQEDQRMYRESVYLLIPYLLEPVCPWLFKSAPSFRTLGEQKPFLMIDSGLDRP
ncbi:SecDF P1 head subdomain-containing protein [Akkermansia sp. AKK6]